MNTPVFVPESLQSIADFCKSNGISKAFFYKLREQGKAPKITKLGSRSMITPEARHEWLTSLNQESHS